MSRGSGGNDGRHGDVRFRLLALLLRRRNSDTRLLLLRLLLRLLRLRWRRNYCRSSLGLEPIGK